MIVFDFFRAHILENAPILMGLIAALGLILQRRNIAEIIKGMLLAAFGMLILSAGIGMLFGSIAGINSAFLAFTGEGVATGYGDVLFTEIYGGDVGLAMLIALILHLVLVRITPFKNVFLTGHMMWWFPFIFVAAGVEAGMRGMPLVVFAAVISALYFTIMPFVLRKYVWAVIGDQSFTLGHPTGVLSLVAGFVASKVGNKARSTEDLALPKWLSFFKEASVMGAIIVFLIWIIVGLIIPGLAQGNLLMESISAGLNFGAGLIILLTGVRMLISQIVPAFKGISDKLIPNAIPALDCPVLFSYKPNAVIIGFLVGMIVSTIFIVIFNTTGVFGILLIPLVITSFFELGTAAVIGEGQGGLRGAIAGTTVSAVIMVLLVGISAMVYAGTIQNWILIFGGNDFSLFGPLARLIGGFFAIFGGG